MRPAPRRDSRPGDQAAAALIDRFVRAALVFFLGFFFALADAAVRGQGEFGEPVALLKWTS